MGVSEYHRDHDLNKRMMLIDSLVSQVLAVDHETKTAGWIKHFIPTKIANVPVVTTSYRDILPQLATYNLVGGLGYQPTFLNSNLSCHCDAALELIFNAACWDVKLTQRDAVDCFGLSPTLFESVAASIDAQDPVPRTSAAVASIPRQMTFARDAVLAALSPVTGTPIGQMGSCIVNLRAILTWLGAGPPPTGIFPVVGKCPAGAAVALSRGGKQQTWRLEDGWILSISSSQMFSFFKSRPGGERICPFAVGSSILQGATPTSGVKAICHCPSCAGQKVVVDCYVDLAAFAASPALAPPFLLMYCLDLAKCAADHGGFSPFTQRPFPEKKLAVLEGLLPFGLTGEHYTLIGVARHIPDFDGTSKGGHWNCDVYQPLKGWFHAENLTGQSTELNLFNDDRHSCGYLWYKNGGN